MKFELKTENENYSNSFSLIFKTILSLVLIIIFCDVAFKIGIISRHYQIDYSCRVLSVEKSTSNLKRLARISNLKKSLRLVKKNLENFLFQSSAQISLFNYMLRHLIAAIATAVTLKFSEFSITFFTSNGPNLLLASLYERSKDL